MATQVQLRRGNTSQTNAFTGAVAEITIDTDKQTVIVHDSLTAGGFPLARESSVTIVGSYANSAYNQANTATTNAATADAKAVSAVSYANSAYNQANISLTLAQSAYDYANTIVSDTQVDPYARPHANAAFDKANSAFTVASSASADGLAFAIALG
jgi:hypothetical protein